MITYKEGNILEANTEALVNTVNTVGVMGKGIALQFKNNFPESYKAYKEAVERNQIQLGQVQFVQVNTTTNTKYIINFPTKGHWRYPSKMKWISEGLQDLKQKIIDYDIKSVAIPPLGCGNGKLDWQEVKTEMEKALQDLNTDILIFEPSDKIKAAIQKENTNASDKLTPARAMLLFLLYKYRALGEFASEFAAEKLSYFLQRFGEKQLKLNFEKGAYGPYSGKVRHVLYVMNGYYLKGFEQKQALPFEELELQVGKKPEVEEYITQNVSKTDKARLSNVVDFMEGFETPYGLELLATTDYVISEQNTFDPEVIKKKIHSWSNRKKGMFSDEHIDKAIHHLQQYKSQLYAANHQ